MAIVKERIIRKFKLAPHLFIIRFTAINMLIKTESVSPTLPRETPGTYTLADIGAILNQVLDRIQNLEGEF
jgi:hypothetical protein